MNPAAATSFEERVGHPPSLFLLFFAEMWERFSYYGMRALLIFYMTKGFLGLNDDDAYAVYGAYTALVYMTPFFGGMLADRILGPRRGVIIGGLLMAAGHLLMGVENQVAFYAALALLIAGNGFFKPNISNMVGSLYKGDRVKKRDSGFTVFYMGINLGATLSALLCGYIGETYGWHYGFGLATVGMITGVAIFTAPTRLTQVLIGAGAAAASAFLVWKGVKNDVITFWVNVPVAIALVISAFLSIAALNHGGLPHDIGSPPKAEGVNKKQAVILLITMLSLLPMALLVHYSTIAGVLLTLVGIVGYGAIFVQALRSDKVERGRLFAILTTYFFTMLFWAFFEQAGSSMNNFTDRNVDRVAEAEVVTSEQVGTTLTIRPTQEQIGYAHEGRPFSMDRLTVLKKEWTDKGIEVEDQKISWRVGPNHVGMGIGGTEVPASEFQGVNPIFILVFGLVFTAIWGFLGKRGLEPSTPAKFVFALVQIGAGFVLLWWGAENADARGMVDVKWLILGILLHTTGELCLSPVGLSMVSKLAPKQMVSTLMGGWFLATAFSQYLAGIIARMTGVTEEANGVQVVPLPSQTVHVYGDVFLRIGIAAGVSALLLLILTPFFKRWMHSEMPMTGEEAELEPQRQAS